eukprot:2489906-Amphidinium_carterae.1
MAEFQARVAIHSAAEAGIRASARQRGKEWREYVRRNEGKRALHAFAKTQEIAVGDPLVEAEPAQAFGALAAVVEPWW